LKKFYEIISVVFGVSAYTYMVVSTIIGTGEGLSLTTFGLWAALAWITGFTMLKQGANPVIPMVYGTGSTLTALVLLFKGKYQWTMMDTVIAILVLVCIILWKTRGTKWALILSVVASMVAGIPFVIMTWKNPMGSPIIPNLGFLATNIFSFAAAKAWTLEDRLYTGTSIILCLFLVVPWLISYLFLVIPLLFS
jgi:hypothetical protein